MKSRKKLKNKIIYLKSEIDSLRKEIQTLVFEPNSIKAVSLKVLYDMRRDMERTVLFGTREWHKEGVIEKSK